MPRELLTYAMAAELLHLSVSTLRHLVSSRGIPFIKIGAAVRFDGELLEAWIAAKRVPAIASKANA